MKKTQKYMTILALVLPIVLGACGSSESTATTSTVAVTTTADKSDYRNKMVCTPGACGADGTDEKYLQLVKQSLTPAFRSGISDADFFYLADQWCRVVNETGGWAKIKSGVQERYDKGEVGAYNLMVFSLLGATSYCLSNFPEIRGYVESLPQLDP